jgi:uncharacterized protein (UPF0335 family)
MNDNEGEASIMDQLQLGKLQAEVEQLKDDMKTLKDDVKELLALANKSKGGFWMGMTIASIVGGFISWIVSHANWFKA